MVEYLLFIFMIIIVIVDSQHVKRMSSRNHEGLCARFGTILTPLDMGQIVVSELPSVVFVDTLWPDKIAR